MVTCDVYISFRKNETNGASIRSKYAPFYNGFFKKLKRILEN